MLPDHQPLLLRQPAPLLEHRVGRSNLADVVEARSQADHTRFRWSEAQGESQLEGHRGDLLGMLSGMLIARVNQGRQRLHGAQEGCCLP